MAFILLLACSWLFLLLWVVLKLTQGRVVYSQWRIGKGEKQFLLHKFSTLRDAAPGEDEYADQQKRLTPAGKFLRRFSLDELPQLWNILKGEMSFVGPRPLLPEYLPLYSAEQKKRHLVKPGLTGWAQIQGRNLLTWKERLALDVWYVENRSFAIDVGILLRTPILVFAGRGVYADGRTTMPPFDGNN